MDIDRIVEDIQAAEERRRAAMEDVRSRLSSTTPSVSPADSFIVPVEEREVGEITVGGVDGGLVRKEMHGMDLILRRAVAAIFSYEDGELTDADYIPERTPSPDADHVVAGMARGEVDRLASLHRIGSEVDAAQEAVDAVDLLLLDGSLLPQPHDRPEEGSELYPRYTDVTDRYRRLYHAAEESGTLIAGVVEDSRSARIASLLREEEITDERIETGRDTVLLTYLLEPGERTMVVPYSGSPQPVIDDVDAAGSFHVFYLRTTAKDRPVRVEFYAPDAPTERADRIASHILGLCGEDSSYGIPPVLIEADQRAALDGNEVDLLSKRIRAKLAHLPDVDTLRRDRRPF